MQQVFGLLLAMVLLIALSFILAVGIISLICYSYFYFKFKSWKYYKRCFFFTFLGGCVGVLITFVILPKTVNAFIPYSVLFISMLAGGFGGLVGKKNVNTH